MAAGLHDSVKLCEPALQVIEVPHAEADGRSVERIRVERQVQCIALHPLDNAGLLARSCEHRLGEVDADDLARDG